jgi:pimeloyl-ACP methyl ester carboxylesterase
MPRVRDAIAAYIRKNKLDHPVIIGHSLGGMMALDLAAHEPDLTGKLVIVDSYPFLMGATNPNTTPEQAREIAAQIRGYIGGQSKDAYDAYVKSGVGMRSMVERDSDFQRLVAWGLASDRTAVGDWMAELYSIDMREDVARIKVPVLVMASYIGFQGATRAGVEANLKAQYAKLAGVEIQVTDKAHHFIMWDDPEWMFGLTDRFLGMAAAAGKK